MTTQTAIPQNKLSLPEPSEWEAILIEGPWGVRYSPPKGSEPNWFHRWMQRLCFGIKWHRRTASEAK